MGLGPGEKRRKFKLLKKLRHFSSHFLAKKKYYSMFSLSGMCFYLDAFFKLFVCLTHFSMVYCDKQTFHFLYKSGFKLSYFNECKGRQTYFCLKQSVGYISSNSQLYAFLCLLRSKSDHGSKRPQPNIFRASNGLTTK